MRYINLLPLYYRPWLLGLWLLLFPVAKSQGQNITRPNIVGPDGLMVNSYTGNLFFQRTDMFIPGLSDPIDMTFSYNSASRKRNDGFGYGWTFPYNMRYEQNADSTIMVWGDGRKEIYCNQTVKSGGGSSGGRVIVIDISLNCFPDKGIFNQLREYEEGKLRLTTKDGTEYYFEDSSHKKLTMIRDRLGQVTKLEYNNDGQLDYILDPSERKYDLQWSNGLLQSISDNNGEQTRVFKYGYNAQGDLTSVTDPLGETVQYFYGRDHTLVAITDKNGNSLDISYDNNFAVTKMASCLSVQKIFFSPETGKTYVREQSANGNQTTTYSFDDKGNLLNKQGNCCGYNMSFAYDGSLNVREMTDANGNTTRFTYDNRGNLLTETDALGNTMTYTYDTKFNQITSITDRNGYRTEYIYNENGTLKEIRRPEGITESFEYYPDGTLKTATDGKELTTSYIYDDNGYPVQITDAENQITKLKFDEQGNLIEQTDANGNLTTYTFDKMNRLKEVQAPHGQVTKLDYDAKGNLQVLTDANNYKTEYFYDPLDRLIEEKDIYGNSTTYTYDELGNQTSMTDENGNTTRYEYDELNRLSSETNAQGETIFYRYDGNGNLKQEVMPDGNTIHYDYDPLDQVKLVRDNYGTIADYSYDKQGNLTSETDGIGNSVSYRYDALNRTRFITDPLGQVTEYQYDKNGNITKLIDRKKQITSYTYDDVNRLTIIKDAHQNETEYFYDAAGNLESMKDANEHFTNYSYDSLNRVKEEAYADGGTVAYTYDKVGNIKTLKDQKNQITQYSYDSLYRLKQTNYPNSPDESFTYYNNGNLKTANNQGAQISFAYDAANRQIAETLNGQTTSYQYDVSGNIRRVFYPNDKVVEEKMDGRARLSSIQYGNQTLATFDYNAGDQLTSKSYPSNATSTQYRYDSNGRLTSLQHNPSSFLSYAYRYDEEDNRLNTQVLHRTNRSEQFGYDELSRLTSYQRGPPDSFGEQFHYDPLGNRTTASVGGTNYNYASNEVNEYTNINGFTPEYDDNGNLENDGTYTYRYDDANRLIEVYSGNTKLASYQYDALGRRIQKITPQATTQYFYDGQRVVEEHTGASVTNYLYGNWIDDVLAMERDGQLYYYHHNALGSVAGISDQTGKLVEQYEYDPYGNVTILDGQFQPRASSVIGNPYLFTGRRLEAETGLYYYRARHYDPETGRFLQRDPLGYVDGNNLYAYAVNNPVNFFDPLGTEICACYSNFVLRGLCTLGENFPPEEAILWFPPFRAVQLIRGLGALRAGLIGLRQGGIAGIKAATKNSIARAGSALQAGGRSAVNTAIAAAQQTGARFGIGTAQAVGKGAINETAAIAASKSTALIVLPQFSSKSSAFRHYAKHSKGIILGKNGKVSLKAGGADLPMYKSLDEYVSGAQQFFVRNGSNILTKTRSNGDILRFETNTGYFGVRGSNGTIKTFFKPDNGIDYFLKQ